MIFSSAPFRISLLGGGSDLPEYFSKKVGQVISFSVNHRSRVFVKRLSPLFDYKYQAFWSSLERTNNLADLKHPTIRNAVISAGIEAGLELHHSGDLPGSSGIGTSSAFSVALVAALEKVKLGYTPHLDKSGIALAAYHIDREMNKECVGLQDHVAASYGGFNLIRFSNSLTNLHEVENLLTLPVVRSIVEDCILVFTSRVSQAPTMEKTKLLNHSWFETVERQVDLCSQGLLLLRTGGSKEELGELVSESWRLKRSLSASVSNPVIDGLIDDANDAGFYGSKLLGAGGGGFVLLMGGERAQEKLFSKRPTLKYVRVSLDSQGVVVQNISPGAP